MYNTVHFLTLHCLYYCSSYSVTVSGKIILRSLLGFTISFVWLTRVKNGSEEMVLSCVRIFFYFHPNSRTYDNSNLIIDKLPYTTSMTKFQSFSVSSVDQVLLITATYAMCLCSVSQRNQIQYMDK
jgi:hypothetical protein